MPSQAVSKPNCAAGRAKTWSTAVATTLAIRTFLPSPITNRVAPRAKSLEVTVREANSRDTVT